MATVLRRLRIKEVSLCENGANQKADILLHKSMDEGATNMTFDLTKITDEALRKMVQDEITRITALKDEAVNKATKAESDLSAATEQINKSKPVDPFAGVPEAIRKQFEDTQKALKIERDARLDRENEILVKSLVGSVPCDAVALAKVFKNLSDSDRTVIETFMKSAKEVSGKVAELTKQTGIDGSAPASDSPVAKLTAIAKAFVDAGVCKNMGEALAKAGHENKDLYAAYRNDMRKQ